MQDPSCPVNIAVAMSSTHVTPSGITVDGDVWLDETRYDAASDSYYEYRRYLEPDEYDAEAVNALLAEGHFDVFMCHNSEDTSEVREIASRLRAAGLRPWLDVEQLIAGGPVSEQIEQAIGDAGAAAIFVGASGEGPWQRREIQGILMSFIEDHDRPVIPVLLPTAPPGTQPKLPLFLRTFEWVDFRGAGGQPLRKLYRGITGKKAS